MACGGPSFEASDRLAPEYADDAFDGPRLMPRSERPPIATGAAPKAPIVSEPVEVGRPTSGSPDCTSELWPVVVAVVGECA